MAATATFDSCGVARHTGDAQMLRLTEHIERAAKHGALESIGNFLREMREEDWFHIGD
jgi:hypothetical protein